MVRNLQVETVRSQVLSPRHRRHVVISPRPSDASKIAHIRAIFLPTLRTDYPALKAKFVSLGPIFSKAPDCGQTVQSFSHLILRGYSA